jgi:hypothetical protein
MSHSLKLFVNCLGLPFLESFVYLEEEIFLNARLFVSIKNNILILFLSMHHVSKKNIIICAVRVDSFNTQITLLLIHFRFFFLTKLK